jgi:molecular chaperone GrpE
MPSSPGAERDSPPAGDERAETESPAASASDRDDLQADLAAAEDRFLRARADLENYRKRADRELERRLRDQTDEVLRAWLEVVDSVERALALENGSGDQEGLRAVLDQMRAILARQGATRFGDVGEAFDPELHEAIAAVPAPGRPAGTIAQVARSGYSAGDRVLRPAQVAVVSPRGDGD